MTKNLTIFDYGDHNVRVISKNGEPLFCVKDIGDVLDIKKIRNRIKNLDQNGVFTKGALSKGGVQTFTFVNEANLYRLIFQSKVKGAIQFQNWVFEEVLPCIRKTGKYEISPELKAISTEKRLKLTSSWKACGITNPKEYGRLTLEEYKVLGLSKNKRKKDMTQKELIALETLESIERLKLFNSDKKGFKECRESLQDTGEVVKFIQTES